MVVPVLRNVERLGLAAIERAIGDFGARAVAAWYRSAAGGPGRGWGQAECYSASLRWSQVMATQPGMTGNQNVSMRNRSTAATARSDDNPIAVRPPM